MLRWVRERIRNQQVVGRREPRMGRPKEEEREMRERLLKRTVLILMMGAVTACSTVYSGTSGLSTPAQYNPASGNLTQEFSASLDAMWGATIAALEALELTVVRRAKDQLGGRVVARRADGTDVVVTLRPIGLSLTSVLIEVGRGDKQASIRISQELERRVKR